MTEREAKEFVKNTCSVVLRAQLDMWLRCGFELEELKVVHFGGAHPSCEVLPLAFRR